MTSQAVAERVVPHDLDAEKALLGAILLDNARLSEACEHITGAQFFRAAHRRIFECMVTIAERRDAIDSVTLRGALGADIEAMGGPAYIASLLDGVPHGMNVATYARIIAEKAALRALISAGNMLVTKGYEAGHHASEVLEEAERLIIGLADQQTVGGFESMRAIAPRAMDFLERMHATRGAISGVPTGFTDLDNLTRGFQPGTLVVLGARPGVGKTSFALNATAHAAAKGKRVAFFSLEMPNEELFIRQVASMARLDSHRLQSGYVSDRDWGRIAEAVNLLCETPILSDETPAVGIFQVRSRGRRLKVEQGFDLLVIDYLQLMTTAGDYDTRAMEIAALTSALKSFAKELKIPILLLSQLSRDHVKRGERPRLSDLRDSGAIEQDADIVMFLYRGEDPEEAPGGGTVAELIIAKHRNGPIGTIKLAWHEEYTRFDDYAELPAEPEDRRLPMGDR